MQEKTRRRLDQSMALIPRPASAMDNNKRVRASWAGSANEQHSVEFASSRLSNMQDARGSLPPPFLDGWWSDGTAELRGNGT